MNPSVRANIAMQWRPEELAAVDAAARRAGVSRSEWIREACRQRLSRERPKV